MTKNISLSQRIGVPHLLGLFALGALAACGGSDSTSVTVDGAKSLAVRAQAPAAATPLAVTLQAQADPLLQGLVIPDDAATKGMWSATQYWTINGIHAALMPDGKVLTYGTSKDSPGGQNGRTMDTWTPSLGFGSNSHSMWYEGSNATDSFCSTSAWLGDGRLMISGGNGSLQTLFMAPSTGQGTPDISRMADQRWYATMLTLPDSRNLIVGGMEAYSEGMVDNPDAAIANGTVSMTPEVYTPGVGWRNLAGAQSRDAFGPDYLRASYPRAWVAPNGQVFGISAETMWWLDVNASGGNGAVRLAGKFKRPASAAAPVNVGATSSAVMYAPGKVLQVGGNGYFNGDGLPASNMATIVDFNGSNPVLTETAPMSLPRRYVNTVVLPDGKVLATGGTRVGNSGGSDAVYEAEIWNPATGTWTTGARAAQIRVYHSSTLLLPNGTVLSAGGGAPGPVDNQNVELYYPPYLFRSVNGAPQLAPRPVMTAINATRFAYGASVEIDVSTSTPVTRVAMVATGLVTHSFNPSQRFQELSFTQSDGRIKAALPYGGNLAPPGYYQIFVLDASGVPSVGVIVGLGMNGLVKPGLPRDQPIALDSVALPGSSMAGDATGLAVLAAMTAANTPTNAQFMARDGFADARCVSLESVAKPGQWLRHANFRLMLGASDGSALFNGDATFCPEAGLAGTGVTLRSANFPNHVVRHRNNEIWLDTQANDTAFNGSASFVPRPVSPTADLPTLGPVAAAPLTSGGTANYSPGLEGAGLRFSWNFGDGSAATAFGTSSAASHVYAAPGLYSVTLTVSNAAGALKTKTFFQAVYRPPTANSARASTPLLIEPRSGASARLWVVNPDNDSVSVFDTGSNARLAEIATGAAPRTLARAADGSIWVANRDSATLSVISPATLAVTRTVALPRASQPWGLVISAAGPAYVTLEATGQLLKLDGSSGATLATLAVGNNARHLSISADSARLLVSRFITPPLPGEGTARVDTSAAGGQVIAVDASTMTLRSTLMLRHSDKSDNEIQGSGIPNYLGAAVISPDGLSAWVPSKLDNIKRGTLRNAQALNFQNTVRAVSSRIDMGTLSEMSESRVDHDNASMASAAAYDATGSYLFVALETSRQIEVLDAYGGKVLFRIEAGLAPQGLVVSADGSRLYIHNFMSRAVSVVDITPLTKNGELRSTALTTLASITADKLAPAVLKGKQLFYDARDPRLARDSYMSCASCHNDGGHDGRTWDFTSLGEGLRNTPALRGRAGTGQGFLHWSANFDEVQDFEGQIRSLAGGTGLMADGAFTVGSRSQPLGDKKAGLSADLDALAAYLGSFASFAPSPYRNADGTITAAAQAGKTVFTTNCAGCHGGVGFTASVDGSQLRNVGTLAPSSGRRLFATLAGVDIPTLRDVWATAPYLHDGSAATLQAAVGAHNTGTLNASDLANVVAYVQQIGSEETQPLANLALGKSVKQSSLGFGGAPERAVDGNTNGNWSGNSVTHTDTMGQPWWQVDLGQQSTVLSVQLWNRTDCCADRLSGVTVFVSANDMSGRTLAQLTADSTVARLQVASLNGAPSITLPLSAQGRYVKVQVSGSNYLSLAEVQVFGVPSVNLARGRAATQSSTAFDGGSSRVVDGNTDGLYSNNSVSHTDFGAQPWWQVDLGRSVSIDFIQLWNRTDCCTDRLSNFFVLASPTDMTGKTLAQLLADPTVKQVPMSSLSGSYTAGLTLGGFSGRYVRLQLAGTGYLSLAEVQLFGR